MNLDQQFEKNWWGTCQNTLGEELKQLSYARRMGLKFFHDGRSPYAIDTTGLKILDIGGGPVSLLLKANGLNYGKVIDPCTYPEWTIRRYTDANIIFEQIGGEEFDTAQQYDEVWIYNCLQHVLDPKLIIENAKKVSKIIRIFEWVDNGVSEGHPHDLHEKDLNEWLGGVGKVEFINENTAKGKCYYGVFKGDHYE